MKAQTLKKWISGVSFCLAVLSISGIAQAALLDGVPQGTPAQKEFAQFVKSGRYVEALMSWGSAFGRTTFSTSDTGVAVHGYILAQSGLPLMGSHWIVADTNLKKIAPSVRKEVVQVVKKQAELLSSAQAHKSWRQFLTDQGLLELKTQREINRAAKRLAKTPASEVRERAKLYWALSVGAAKINNVRLAEIYIRDLKGLSQKFIGEDKVEMQLARVLFQKNKLNEAIDSYSQIPKSSEFWLEAIEERAWAYLRQGNYDKARSDLTTLLAPTFKDYASAEVYVLAAITNLKICDYPRILEDGRKFKKAHVNRIREMEMLADKGINTHLASILEKMDQTGADLSAAAGKLSSLPRLALRSPEFSVAVNKRAQLLKEKSTVERLKGRLQIMGGNSSLNQLTEWANWEIKNSRTQSLREAKKLAALEVKDYRVNINKLKLAEVEVIHRINVDDSLKGKRGELGEMSQGSDVLVFPYEENERQEVWVDELDNYQARVKDCPNTKGAAL